MSRINMSFFNAYKELDSACAKRLEISRGGISAYIGKLVELKFLPKISEVLSRLVKYRKIRNVLAHEENAFDRSFEISKADVKWISRFTRKVESGRDPISKYERNKNLYKVWKWIRIAIVTVIVIALIVFLTFIFKT